MTERQVDFKSVYFQDEIEASDAFNIIVGARYDAISNAEDKPTFRVGGIYEFDKLAKLRANAAQGYRTPDMREMYINRQTPNGLHVGADVMGYELRPESTNSFEVGLGGRNNALRYDVVVFYNQINNMIAQTMRTHNGQAVNTFENIENAITAGAEFTLGYSLLSNLDANFFWTELRTRDEETKRALEFQPRRMIMLGLNYSATKDLYLGIIARHVGEQHFTEVSDRGSPTESQNHNAIANTMNIVDFNIDYDFNKMIAIYGGINNVGDAKVDDVLGSNVGRYYFVGARAQF